MDLVVASCESISTGTFLFVVFIGKFQAMNLMNESKIMSHVALTWVGQCLKLIKELLPNELKLRDEGALKTFTLFLLGFILMAGLQALEAYLDMWFLYQTDTFHAEIMINTCVTKIV